MWGLSLTGFVVKVLTEIKSDLESAIRGAFGASANVTPKSVFGQLIGILSDRVAELWEVLQAIDSSRDPDKAEGAALDSICALTGTIRLKAEASTVTLTLTGTPTTVLSAGRQVSTASTALKFEIGNAATIAALPVWTGATAYIVGDRRTNSSRVYQCITAGTSAGSGGPTTTAADITDNTAHWRYCGEGTGAIDADAVATATGPKIAVSGDITVIETPVAGWSSVINLLDAELGRNVETDAELRVRREQELVAGAKSTVEAIRSAVLDVDDVTACLVFENTTLVTDGDGLPGKSVEVLVEGGADADIRAAIFAHVSAGISTHGGVSGTVTDSQGFSHTVKFSRATETDIYVAITLVKDAANYPTDGDAQVKAAIVAFGDLSAFGKNAVSTSILAQAFKVAGVLDVTSCYIGTAPSPVSSATIAIPIRGKAIFDTSRVSVVTSDGTP